MLKGGYQIIDLENRDFKQAVGITVEGSYSKIEGTRKPILLSGLQFNSVEMHDMWVDFYPVGSQYIAINRLNFVEGVKTIVITVNDKDIIVISVS